jgi:hypothetical protein
MAAILSSAKESFPSPKIRCTKALLLNAGWISQREVEAIIIVPEISEKLYPSQSKRCLCYSSLASKSNQGLWECRTSSDGGNELFDSDAFLGVGFKDRDKDVIQFVR